MRICITNIRPLFIACLALLLAGTVGHVPALAQAGGCDKDKCGGSIELPPVVEPDPGDPGGDDDDDGGGDDGGDETPPPPADDECVPGTHVEQGDLLNQGGDCYVTWYQVDNCTGEVIMAGYWAVECPVPDDDGDDDFVCDEGWSLGDDGFTCERLIDGVRLEAFAAWPEITFDVRPYPATMIRWPTSMRLSNLATTSGSDGYDYYARGGGSPGDPEEGDWRDIVFRISLKPSPVNFAEAALPHVGDMVLPLAGPSGTPTVFEFPLPSHPDAGGVDAPASDVGLPSDFTAFAGQGRAPYELHWSLTYEEWEEWDECLERDDDDEDGDGETDECIEEEHHEKWDGRSQGGVIPPTEIPDLPAKFAADVDNDGTPDALWDYNTRMRRMDDGGAPTGYVRDWGNTLYWWVREGQGQIGAP